MASAVVLCQMETLNSFPTLPLAFLPVCVPVSAWYERPVFSVNTSDELLPDSDVEILGRVARGDLDAFGQFYDRHSSLLFSLALKILRDHHEAEETLQEAMTLIWERASGYNAALGKPVGWAVTITRNKAIDRLRSTQRKHRFISEAAPEFETQMLCADRSTERQAIAGETATMMRHALGTLPTEQRRAIEMAFLGGLTHLEIAAQLGEPIGTIKARIRRGMVTLRDALEDKL